MAYKDLVIAIFGSKQVRAVVCEDDFIKILPKMMHRKKTPTSKLNDDDRVQLIMMRFGLGTYREKITLKEIGDKYGVGCERIRQLEAMALRMLREPKNLIKYAFDPLEISGSYEVSALNALLATKAA